MSRDVPEVGAPLDGRRYELLHPVGTGGMSRVYLARHTALQSKVVVKLLDEPFAGRADLRGADLQDGKRPPARAAAGWCVPTEQMPDPDVIATRTAPHPVPVAVLGKGGASEHSPRSVRRCLLLAGVSATVVALVLFALVRT